MTTGERIRAIRSALGLTQADLADRLHVSRSYQCRIENGSSTISLDYIQSAAEALGVPPQEILRDIFVYPEDVSAAEQIRTLMEQFPQEDQTLTLETLRKIVKRLYPEKK